MSQLPSKQVGYGNDMVAAIRDGSNVYASFNGKTILDESFPSVTVAKSYFDRLQSIPRQDSQASFVQQLVTA